MTYSSCSLAMRKALCAVLALVLLMSAAAQAVEAPKWVNPNLPGSVTAETPTSARENYAMWANRDWILKTEIPAGKTRWDGLNEVGQGLEKKLITLIHDDTLTDSDAEQVHLLRNLLSDWDRRNALGTDAARSYLEGLEKAQSLAEMTDWMESEDNLFLTYPVSVHVGADLDDPTLQVVNVSAVGQEELFLNDAAEYRNETDTGKLYRDLAEVTAVYMLKRLGRSEEEAKKVFENAVAFEKLMAQYMPTRSELADEKKTMDNVQKCTLQELTEMSGSFPIARILQVRGLAHSDIYAVQQPDYLKHADQLYTEENLQLIKDWVLAHTVIDMRTWLDRAALDETSALRSAVDGTPGTLSDDQVMLKQIGDTLCVPLDNLYIAACCTESMRDKVMEVISVIKEKYRVMLSEETWLTEETRAKAVEKLDNMAVNAVYPTEQGDWSALRFEGYEEGGNLLSFLRKLNAFTAQLDAARVNTRRKKGYWDQRVMRTSIVNAFYEPQDNSINILAGILGEPMYREDMSQEEILGGIGVVIGHEISHAFDPTGSLYDKDGRYANWWTAEDHEAFQRRAEKLIAYYNTISPLEGVTCAGVRLQGEAVADMGGVKSALAVAAGQENFAYDAFFRAFARVWRAQMLPSAVRMLTASDVHPLAYLRINVTLQQFDEFVNCYGVQPGDMMYLAPEDRIAIW